MISPNTPIIQGKSSGVRLPPTARSSPSVYVFLPQVGSPRRDQRMELCQEGNGPHEVAANEGEYEG